MASPCEHTRACSLCVMQCVGRSCKAAFFTVLYSVPMTTTTAQTHTRAQTTLTDYFKEIIYGGIDGIVTTFAVVAGFAGAALSSSEVTQLSFLVVLLFGLANLFADAASMGLGNFLSVRSEQDLYNAAREKEATEIRHNTEAEIAETIGSPPVPRGTPHSWHSHIAPLVRFQRNVHRHVARRLTQEKGADWSSFLYS
jgi:Uncharacterized membrane protein